MKKKGFTLVELVITIAIVIILSVISVPIYRGYVDKAKWSEAYALLGMIYSAQKNYYSEYGNFLDENQSSSGTGNFTCNEEVLGIDARGNKYFTFFTVNWDGGHINRGFDAYVRIPDNLAHGGYNLLRLIYNITTGSKFSEVTSQAWEEK